MPDHLSPQKRSALMRRIKGSSTKPERLISQALDELGIKHKRNDRKLPGTPDVAIHDRRVAIFVHGCFWHGCPLHYREPKTRRKFWAHKLQCTKARDKRTRTALLVLGWKVSTIWEHEAKADPVAAVKRALEGGGRGSPTRGKSSTRRVLLPSKGL